MSEINTESNNSPAFDAQQITENVEAGEQQLPTVDVSADYEASKEFTVSEVDRTGAGAKAAAAATAPKFDIPAPQETAKPADSSAKSDDFRSMAQEVNPAATPDNVTEDLIDKAIDLGTPGS